MADVQIKIKNIAQIKAAFNRAPLLMSKELNIAIRKTVIGVQRRSLQNTPVDTGRLRASTYTQFMPLKGMVGTDTDYDIFVHEGTRFMKARPFLREAVEESDNDIDDNFTKAVDNVLSSIGRLV